MHTLTTWMSTLTLGHPCTLSRSKSMSLNEQVSKSFAVVSPLVMISRSLIFWRLNARGPKLPSSPSQLLLGSTIFSNGLTPLWNLAVASAKLIPRNSAAPQTPRGYVDHVYMDMILRGTSLWSDSLKEKSSCAILINGSSLRPTKIVPLRERRRLERPLHLTRRARVWLHHTSARPILR
jgi:hypothetical protein